MQASPEALTDEGLMEDLIKEGLMVGLTNEALTNKALIKDLLEDLSTELLTNI